MSKMNELAQVLDELIVCGEKLAETAKAVRTMFETDVRAEEPSEEKPEEKPVKEEKAYSFIDVRQAFAAKSHEGFTDRIKALIAKYGATRLSEVKEEDYAAIMAEMEEMV